MKRICRLVLAPAFALTAAGALVAEQPNYGLALSIGVPMGDYREMSHAPTATLPLGAVEGYDVGIGAQFTAAIPMQDHFAFRMGLSRIKTKGSYTADSETVALDHTIFSLLGELQFFFDDAYRHNGPYIVAGLSGDFERFERPIGIDDRWASGVSRANRLGGTVGIGHNFGDSRRNKGDNNFVMELCYHFTLTGKDPAALDPQASNFLKVNIGFVF